MPVVPGETPCLRCVFETTPAAGSLPTCETAGVLGSAVTVVAGLQVTETIKLLIGAHEQVARILLRYDAWKPEFTAIALGEPRVGCSVCGAGDYAYLEGREGARAAHLCGREAIQFLPREGRVSELAAIAGRLADTWEVTRNEHLVRAKRGRHTVTVFANGRVIVDGTTDEREARSLVARVVGT
jgi:adenylyltransferase/sulfurtransferase